MRASLWIGLLSLVLLSCRPQTGPPPRDALWHHQGQLLKSMPELRAAAPASSAPSCGFPVHIQAALPDPTNVPDRLGEWVELSHHEVELLDLAGWRLESAGRTRALEAVILSPGDPLRIGGEWSTLRPLQLRNTGGTVQLFDPCGLEISRLSWGASNGLSLRPGEQINRQRLPVQNAKTPPEESQAGLYWWLRMDLNHRPNDYESFALTPELRSRWGEHLASRAPHRQPRMAKSDG